MVCFCVIPNTFFYIRSERTVSFTILLYTLDFSPARIYFMWNGNRNLIFVVINTTFCGLNIRKPLFIFMLGTYKNNFFVLTYWYKFWGQPVQFYQNVNGSYTQRDMQTVYCTFQQQKNGNKLIDIFYQQKQMTDINQHKYISKT